MPAAPSAWRCRPAVVSTTGIGGLTLGGGHGYLARKYGLAIDNLLEADVVLADGRLVTASARQNEDLFWAIRGGGGNFGVVTSFLFQAQPVGEVVAGLMLWDFEQTAEMMRWYDQFLPAASEDLYGFFAIMNVPPVPLFPVHLHKPDRLRRDLVPSRSARAGGEGPGRRAGVASADVRADRPHAHHRPAEHVRCAHAPGIAVVLERRFLHGAERCGHRAAHQVRLAIADAAVLMHLYPIDGQVNRIPP